MKGFRVLAGTLVSLALSVCSWAADVRAIDYSQILEQPAGQAFTRFATNVAIDGADLIVLATYDGGQSALLYQRASGSSRFTYRRVLVSLDEPRERLQVRMKNGIAVVQFGDRAWIFERSGGNYVAGVAATPLQYPGGAAISGNSILFGGDGCGYDGVVYQKATDGRWQITGRLDDNQGSCVPQGLAVELNYDTALIHAPGTHEVTTWQRNGAAIDWVRAGNPVINSDVAATSAPFALQNATLVTPASYVYRRSGNTWAARGRVVPGDYGMGAGNAQQVKYRDGLLVTVEEWIPGFHSAVYVYAESAPGVFEHLAILGTGFNLGIVDSDISGRTVVAGLPSSSGGYALIYTLPEPLAAHDRIEADFEDGNAGDFSVFSGQFALAARGSNHVLAQPSTSGFTVAVADASESSLFQLIETKVMPTFGETDGWVGLVAHYVDANNYYYLAARKNGTAGLYRRVNGVTTLIVEWSPGTPAQRLALAWNDGEMQASVNGRPPVAIIIDRTLPRGRAGLVTYRAAADFDEVQIAASRPVPLIQKRFMPDSDVPVRSTGREFNRIGGDWQYLQTSGYLEGYQQRDATRSAFAFIGAPVRNQDIETTVQVNATTSTSGAWVGLLGRYVDAQNHYRATLGNNGRVEIRKTVNGVTTLLASAATTAGTFNQMRFRLVDDQLQLFLNDRRVLSVYDDDIPAGAHGLATNRASATWEYLNVTQP